MAIIKVLKRKDAASVIVAIVIGFGLAQMLSVVTARPAGMLLGLEDGHYISYSFPGGSWVGTYALPVLTFVLQLVVLEALIRLYSLVHQALSKKA